MTELQQQYSELEIKVGTAQANVADTGREVKKAEDSVDQVRTRIKKDQELLNSGAIAAAKQLDDLQHEVASLQRRQLDLEDAQLETMEAAEAAESEARDLVEQAAAVTAQLESAREAESNAKADISGQTDEAKSTRAKIADELGVNDLSKLYDKLRLDHGGVVAARLEGERCGACNLQLSPIDVKKLKDAAEDDVHRCDECRSILVMDGEK